MVRLSLVNMYLHGFTDPHILEYDTLTSEERWNEYADVILANPPFMSPKGGIRPHNRFSVKSKRSEVLFVDYMAEHLMPSGRAGIIVPEGIIFQSQNAYKQLRKMLVEEYLIAVVSLPAGVFQPYSGVKTSILILDKSLAKKADCITFFKVENDGFDLGAQRRPIDKNSLPQAQAEIGEYLRRLRAGEQLHDFQPMLGLIVEKGKLAANEDYTLSGERYRDVQQVRSSFALRPFEDVCTLEYGASLPKAKRVEGPFPVVGSNGITGYHSDFLIKGPTIVIGRKGSAGEVTFIQENCFPIDTTYYVKQTNPSESDLIYLYWVLKSLKLQELRGGAGIPGLNRSEVYQTHQIPLPPLEVQKEIVSEIEGYQKIIDGARAVVDNYRPHIPIGPDWPMVSIKEICKLGRGRVISGRDINNNPGPYPVYSSQTSDEGIFGRLDSYDFDGEYVTWTTDGANAGTVFYRTGKFSCTNVCGTLKSRGDAKNRVDMRFVAQVLGQVAKSYVIQVGNPKLMNKEVAKIAIPLPPLAKQQTIVAEIEAEQALVSANCKLIDRFEKKIQDTLARVWCEDEPDPEKA